MSEEKKSMNQEEFSELVSKTYKQEFKGKFTDNATAAEMAKKFSEYKNKAREYLENNKKLEDFLVKVEKKFQTIPKVGPKLAYIPQMVLLIRSYAICEYREVTKTEIVLMVAALIYFVSPLDVIPDKFLGFGWLDDALVASLVVRRCEGSIKRYMSWLEHKRGVEE